MKKVFIKYNPYKLETEIKVNGNALAQNSKLGEKTAPGSRLQEWVEELPRILIKEYNDKDFQVTFHGTLLDYEDLTAVFTEAHKHGELTATLDRLPAKETTDKETLIDDVFKEIQEGPFDELRDVEIISAFEHAKSSDFEVCVVATMSAGKSTLINAMLGTKLMPSKLEACTAMITRIKDVPEATDFMIETRSGDGSVLEKQQLATFDMVNTHNDCPVKYKCPNRTPECTAMYVDKLTGEKKQCQSLNLGIPHIGTVCLYGNIPFVSSTDVSLVLVDTPGPNNSRDPNHRRIQSKFLSKSSKSLILYIMTGEFGTDDDNALLKRVAESMAVGGKQSKDRFIFVLNKFDERKKEDGEIELTLERVRSYLKAHGIANPNLFPAGALPALNLRLIANGADVDEDTHDETAAKVLKLNRWLHLEANASLPSSIKVGIEQKIADAKSMEDVQGEALIHTGIISIEAAIRQYVQKYAKTAKIKNIVDTFLHRLDDVGCYEETKRELAKNRDESDMIVKQIAKIREKIDSAKSAKKFKDAVDDAVIKVNDDSRKVIENIIIKFQARITNKIDELRGDELDIEDAKDEIERLEKFAKKLEPDFQVDLDELIRDSLVKTSKALLDEYRQKLASLTEDLNTNIGFSIDPLRLMGSSVFGEGISIRQLLKSKEVADGTEWVPVPRKPIFGLGLRDMLFGMKHEERVKHKTVEYIDASQLAQQYLEPCQYYLHDNGEVAHKYTIRQSNRIASQFNIEFKRLDDILKQKLLELESYATDQKKAEERIKESERKLKWLESIKTKVELILEI